MRIAANLLHLIPSVAFICFVQSCSRPANVHSRSKHPASTVELCDILQKSQFFANKTVQTQGWIYADIERFGISNHNCGLELSLSEEANKQDQGAYKQRDSFIRLVVDSKNGTWNTGEKIFAILEGTLEVMPRNVTSENTVPARRQLVITNILCSVSSPLTNHTEGEAHEQCLQSVQSLKDK